MTSVLSHTPTPPPSSSFPLSPYRSASPRVLPPPRWRRREVSQQLNKAWPPTFLQDPPSLPERWGNMERETSFRESTNGVFEAPPSYTRTHAHAHAHAWVHTLHTPLGTEHAPPHALLGDLLTGTKRRSVTPEPSHSDTWPRASCRQAPRQVDAVTLSP